MRSECCPTPQARSRKRRTGAVKCFNSCLKTRTSWSSLNDSRRTCVPRTNISLQSRRRTLTTKRRVFRPVFRPRRHAHDAGDEEAVEARAKYLKLGTQLYQVLALACQGERLWRGVAAWCRLTRDHGPSAHRTLGMGMVGRVFQLQRCCRRCRTPPSHIEQRESHSRECEKPVHMTEDQDEGARWLRGLYNETSRRTIRRQGKA